MEISIFTAKNQWTDRITLDRSVRETYFRLGMRSAMPVMPAMMLLWEIMTPLGMPVEPLVYMITAISDGTGCLRDTITAHRERQIHIPSLVAAML